MSRTFWTPEQTAALVARYPYEKTETIAAGIGRDVKSCYQKATALGLKKSPEFLKSPASGRTNGRQGVGSRFQKGHTTWNKGMKGLDIGGHETRFKKGQKPHTWVPIGSQRVTKDGYLQRKLTDTGYPPRDWKSVHQIMWEEANGPLPEGCVVVFKPGKKTVKADEIRLEDLEMLSRAELMRRNSVHRLPKEIAQLVQLKGALNRQINKRSKQ